jgi:hypothetical protein
MRSLQLNRGTPFLVALALLVASLWVNSQTRNTEAQSTSELAASVVAAGNPTIDPPTKSPTATLTPTPDTPTGTPTVDPSMSPTADPSVMATAGATQTANATQTVVASASAGAGSTATAGAPVLGAVIPCCEINGQTCQGSLGETRTFQEACSECNCPQGSNICTCADLPQDICAWSSAGCLPRCSDCSQPAVPPGFPTITPPPVTTQINTTPVTDPITGSPICPVPTCNPSTWNFPPCTGATCNVSVSWEYVGSCYPVQPGSTFNGLPVYSVGVCAPKYPPELTQCQSSNCSPSSCPAGQLSCGTCCDPSRCALDENGVGRICCGPGAIRPVSGPGYFCDYCGNGTCEAQEKFGQPHYCEQDCPSPTATPTSTATPKVCDSQLGQISCGGVCCDQGKCARDASSNPVICCDVKCQPEVGRCNCCGDGICASDETSNSCPQDCGGGPIRNPGPPAPPPP